MYAFTNQKWKSEKGPFWLLLHKYTGEWWTGGSQNESNGGRWVFRLEQENITNGYKQPTRPMTRATFDERESHIVLDKKMMAWTKYKKILKKKN